MQAVTLDFENTSYYHLSVYPQDLFSSHIHYSRPSGTNLRLSDLTAAILPILCL